MKTVSDFKKLLTVGTKLHCVHHLSIAGWDAENKVIYQDKDLGIREVSIKQSNSFALKTPKGDEFVNSWCDYPKASQCKIEDNKITLLERDARQFNGGHADESNPEYAALPLIPVLTYTIV